MYLTLCTVVLLRGSSCWGGCRCGRHCKTPMYSMRLALCISLSRLYFQSCFSLVHRCCEIATMGRYFLAAASIHLLPLVAAQYFPPIPENITTIRSKFDSGITVSYKEVRHTLLEPYCLQCSHVKADESSSKRPARHLRDNAWRPVLRRLRPPTTGDPCGCR